MELLIIRHGEAVDEAPGQGDIARWLTGKGRKISRKVAQWLAIRDDRRPTEIWTSPLVRAVQTAEIMAEAAALEENVSVCGALSTSGSVTDLVKLVGAYKRLGPLMLVGHEPNLSFFATQLMGSGINWPGFKKSGVLSLRWSGTGLATFRFVLHPKSLEVETDPSRLHG